MNAQEFRPAARMGAIGVSEILQIMQLASDLRRDGCDIIDLSAGEPDFDTPERIKEAAAEAMRRGATKYTLLDGLPELKEAIRTKFRRDNGLEYAPAEIIASAGAKQVFYNAMVASLDPGDEVIIPAPFWTTFRDIVGIAEGVTVSVPCPADRDFLLGPAQLEAAITGRTRWLVLNSPSNPAGAMYSRAHYEALFEVLRRHPDIWVLTDDIYEHIVYDGATFVTPVGVDPELRARTLIVNGVSKAYAMTGWRIGYGCGPKALIRSMLKVQSQATSCPCSISQWATIEALLGPQGILRERCAIFQQRRDRVVELLNRIDGIDCVTPRGAFYAYAGCEGLIGSRTFDGQVIETDTDFAAYLLRAANVAVVPGTPFGLSPFFRLSFTASPDVLEQACGRIADACAGLRGIRTGT
ncbi:MAG: pyridoxal phosphate-dependent aminotransferase [Rhodospirillaceae bacterium]|nr:pyridoxal phosphate-dependent aminotransferase [Rhodospirillaceae bacterium]MDE0362717.1 pyridoxal phosphate-dependent aminotransferase [Rhodospirillaceae bacterium]